MSLELDFAGVEKSSDEELMLDLGEAVAIGPEFRAYKNTVDGLGARVSRVERLKALAASWLQNNNHILHEAVCENQVVRQALSSNPGVSIETFKLLVDAFSSLHVYVPIASLAMLVMRKGLDWVCPPSTTVT